MIGIEDLIRRWIHACIRVSLNTCISQYIRKCVSLPEFSPPRALTCSLSPPLHLSLSRRERNWEGEQRMVAADTAAWVRSLPDENLAAIRAHSTLRAGVDRAPGIGGGKEPPPAKKSGKKRAFLKGLLSGKGAPLPWALPNPGRSLQIRVTNHFYLQNFHILKNIRVLSFQSL